MIRRLSLLYCTRACSVPVWHAHLKFEKGPRRRLGGAKREFLSLERNLLICNLKLFRSFTQVWD
jgi:hypothetical protein